MRSLLCLCINIFLFGLLCGYNMRIDERGLPEIEAVAGGLAQLPCDISEPNKKDLISLILWYRESARQPIYTLDFRKGPPDKAKHFRSGSFNDRAQFDLEQRPPVLKLKPVYEEDRGQYKCRIEYRRSRTITRIVNLKVIVPPHLVLIMDNRGQRLKGIAGPYDEGAYLVLICEAEGGDPLPVVTWWRNGALIDESYLKTTQGHIRNELTITELRRNDLLAELVCQASNTNLTNPINESIKLDLNLKPVYVRITTPKQPLKVSEDVRLDCETSGSRPPAKITWWMQNRKILSEEESFLAGRSLTYSSIVINPSKDDHGKAVICKSDNPSLPNSAMEDVWYIDVLYPPDVSLNLGANIKYSTIREGNDVYLECLVRANPPPTEISWFFEGNVFTSNPSAGVIISNQSLVLQKVRKENRGRYGCSAVNLEGKGQSLDLLLEVRYTPICIPNKKVLYGVGRGEVINISCEVVSDPPDVSFRWALDNSMDQIPLRNFSSNGSYSTVSLAPQSVQDYGSILCWARNSIGEQKEPCATKIIAAGPPDPVRNCFVSNSTTSWLYVRCEAGYDGGLKQKFHLDVYTSNVDLVHSNLTSRDQPVFSVGNLPSGTQFVLVVYSSNEKGKSNSIAFAEATLKQSSVDVDFKPSGSISPLLVVLLVALVILLTAGSGTLGFLFVQKQRQRRKPRKARESKENTKFEEVLKKTAEDILENSIACPDVVPASNGYNGVEDFVEMKETQKPTEPETIEIKCDIEQHDPDKEHLLLAEVEVILTNINNPCSVISRISPSSSKSSEQQWNNKTDTVELLDERKSNNNCTQVV